MLSALALSLLSLAGAAPDGRDTPIVPIPSNLVAIGIGAGELQVMCDEYNGMIPLIESLGPEIAPAVLGWAEIYMLSMFEEGYEGGTESARLTDEAERLIIDYLHTC